MEKEYNKSLGPWFGKTMKMIDFVLEEKLEKTNLDLSKTQFVILRTVSKNEGMCQNELAYFAKRNKSSLTRMINTLEKKNYLTRVSCKEDKRINKLLITPEGNKVLETAKPIFREMANLIEGGLSEEEINSTIQTLKKIQENISGSISKPRI